MKKYDNPFLTLSEAVIALRAIGLDPFDDKAGWTKNIIGISVNKSYDIFKTYYKCSIHLNSVGFDKVMKYLEGKYDVTISSCFADYDMFTVIPSPLLELYKLEPRRTSEESK